MFTSTDQSICEENAGAVTARACMWRVAYAQAINGVRSSSESAGAAQLRKTDTAIDQAYCTTQVHARHVLFAMRIRWCCTIRAETNAEYLGFCCIRKMYLNILKMDNFC